jgi:hypothetical protein
MSWRAYSSRHEMVALDRTYKPDLLRKPDALFDRTCQILPCFIVIYDFIV